MQNNDEPCSICGRSAMSNARVSSRRTVEYLDGPPVASIPSVVVCHDCADEVTDYLNERTGNTESPSNRHSLFEEEDAETLADRLVENDQLVLDPGYGYGIRHVDGEWKQAIMPLPAPPTIETMDREEVEETIQSAARVTLKRLDQAAWDRHQER